jgi:hypothetical protein
MGHATPGPQPSSLIRAVTASGVAAKSALEMILLGEDHVWTFVVVVFAFLQFCWFCWFRRFITHVVLTIKTIATHKVFL